MNIYDARERYRRWWRGKYCRLAYSQSRYKMVSDIKVVGPPSFVYGCAYLVWDDGSETPVMCGNAFKPRKCDVEVKP